MQTDLKHHQLAFLLSLGAFGCVVGDDDDDTDATVTTTASTSNTTSTTASTSDTDPSTTASTTDSTTVSTTDSTTVSTTDATTDATTDDSTSNDPDTGTTGDIPDVCQTFADKYVECYPKYAKYGPEVAGFCAYDLMYGAGISTECATAQEESYACLAALDCAAFTDKTPDCEAENMAVTDNCGGGSSDAGSTSGADGG